MKQSELLELLQEAAHPECTYCRRKTILMMLEMSTAAYDPKTQMFKTRGRAVGILELLEYAYMSIIHNDPEVLAKQWPIFVMMCGDRPRGELLAPVDW